MATKLVTVSGSAWIPLTTYGQSGSCWLVSNVQGRGSIVVDHSTVSGIDCTIQKAYPLYREYGARLAFTADYLADVYYARCTDNAAWAIIAVDTY